MLLGEALRGGDAQRALEGERVVAGAAARARDGLEQRVVQARHDVRPVVLCAVVRQRDLCPESKKSGQQ
eukprot:7563028-Pyramimonas_sp.AAC.1